MDFATVKVLLSFQILTFKQKNLEKGKFQTYDEVFAEIQLIWDNCKLYNLAGSDIYKLAEYMEKFTKRTIQKFRA